MMSFQYTYHIQACTEAALGLVVLYLFTTGVQVPDFNVAILTNTSKELSVI